MSISSRPTTNNPSGCSNRVAGPVASWSMPVSGALPSLTGAAGVDADGTEPSGVLPVDADVGVTPGKRSTTFSSLTDGTTSAADTARAGTSRMPVLIQPFRTICGSTARQSTTQPMPT